MQTQHGGGYNPASTTTMTTSTNRDNSAQKKVPLKASKLFKKDVHPKLGKEEVVDMSTYFADRAPKR